MAAPTLNRLPPLRSPAAVLVVAGVLGGVALGALSAYRLSYGVLALGAAVLVTIIVSRPVNLAVLAVVGVFAVQRLGSTSVQPGSAGGISISDALLAAAAVLAVPAVLNRAESGRLRIAFIGLGIYLSLLLPSVILHPSNRAYLEWTHRLVLVGGSLIVGAWIARERATRTALRWLVVGACLVAVAAVESCVKSGFAPATPLGLNKNFVGGLLAALVVLVMVAPEHIALGPRPQAFVLVVLAAGLLASQSRGSMLAAVAGLLAAFMLDPRGHSRRVRALTVLVALVLGGFAFISIRDQLNQSQADALNGSIGVRYNVEKVTREIWRTSPVTGVGLRYYNTGNYGRNAVAANVVVDNELAESGVLGLLGFVALQGFVLAAGIRRRRDGKLVAAAVGMVAAHLLHGMVDIYWSAAIVALPFMIMGMALGTGEMMEEAMARGVPMRTRPSRQPLSRRRR